jgi:hypothetical protein
MNLFKFIPGYENAIFSSGREPAFVMLLAFVVTFIFARGYTRMARKKGWGSVSFGGVHTHHLVFGMLLAFVAGAVVFCFNPSYHTPIFLLSAAMFGGGVALVLDEFALVFHLKDVYWENEGRKSVDAVIIAFILGLIFLLHITPFGTTAKSSGTVLALAVLINLPIVIVAALKGKVFIAIAGVFVPFLAVIGAVRLAEPGSGWAHKFYKPGGKKMVNAIKRYNNYEKTWRPRKEHFRDLAGGKLGGPL